MVCGLISWLASTVADRGRAEQQVPYVPPVTPNTLPANEILVRGAEEPPVARSKMLLRAAQGGHETATEELLWVVDD